MALYIKFNGLVKVDETLLTKDEWKELYKNDIEFFFENFIMDNLEYFLEETSGLIELIEDVHWHNDDSDTCEENKEENVENDTEEDEDYYSRDN